MGEHRDVFTCKKCGKCCTLFHLFTKGTYPRNELDSGDGTCKYFDRETRLCTIYASRPLICNHDRYYDEYLKDRITREEFDAFLNIFCERIRRDDV